MIRPRRQHRAAFALIEVLVAVLFIGVFMLALLQVRNQALHSFITSSDQHTGAWLAELKMAELVSQDLPDPSDTENVEGWGYSGSGDFAYLDDRVNDINDRINEEWVTRETFSKFEYEWTKELIFIGPDFIGDQYEIENWEPPIDDYGEELEEDDPLEKPAARVVRVTLVVKLPMHGREAETYEEEVQQRDRRTIKLVTYVDPAALYQPSHEASEAADETPAPATPPEGGG